MRRKEHGSGAWGEKGKRCESSAITVAVCVSMFYAVGESRSLGN